MGCNSTTKVSLAVLVAFSTQRGFAQAVTTERAEALTFPLYRLDKL